MGKADRQIRQSVMLEHQTLKSKVQQQSISWFPIGIWLIFLASLALRFWGLGRFNVLVFDEVYYAKFANQFLQGKYVFYSHPPLGHYFVALGIWLGKYLPFGNDMVNNLTGSTISTFSYRWMNALFGSFIPVIVIGIAYQLTKKRSFALIAGFLVAADGLYLVESRYALNNMYMLVFGFLGHLLVLLALNRHSWQRWLWLLLAGIAFGASIGTKWNGLYFLIGVYLLWVLAWLVRTFIPQVSNRDKTTFTLQVFNPDEIRDLRFNNVPIVWLLLREIDAMAGILFLGKSLTDSINVSTIQLPAPKTPLKHFSQLSLPDMSFFLGVVPVVVYILLWIPYLSLERLPHFFSNFAQEQEQILDYHNSIKDGPKVHPYCSKWFTWVLMLRPIAYFYATARNTSETVPLTPPLPAGVGKVIYDVHAMGNPLLYIFSFVAIFIVIAFLTTNLIAWVKGDRHNILQNVSTWVLAYILLNYAVNLLPWVRVTRCTFLYHYMPSSVFAFLALAWVIDWFLHSWKVNLRATGITLIFLVLLSFVYWMPIYLGLPLSQPEYNARMIRVDAKNLPTWVKDFFPNWI
jgi:dolichyl-phosphate-mannose-protein mannosyltransferase